MWVTRSMSASGRAARRNSSSVEQASGCSRATAKIAQFRSAMRNEPSASSSGAARYPSSSRIFASSRDLGGEGGLAIETGSGRLDAVVSAVLERAGHRGRGQVAEQLVGQLAVGAGEQRLGSGGYPVAALGPPLLAGRPGDVAGLDQPGGGQSAEVLAGAAHGHVEHLGDIGHRGLAASAHGIEHVALRRRDRRRHAHPWSRCVAHRWVRGARSGTIKWTSPNSCHRYPAANAVA